MNIFAFNFFHPDWKVFRLTHIWDNLRQHSYRRNNIRMSMLYIHHSAAMRNVGLSIHSVGLSICRTVASRNIEMPPLKNGESDLQRKLRPVTNTFEPKKDHLYHPRHVSWFSTLSVNTVYHGTKGISFLRLKVWNLLSN